MSLRHTISTPLGKQRYVRRLFATIADRYDFITRFLSCGQDARWKRRLIALASLKETDRLLDLACGTGDLLFAAAPHVRCAVGADVTFRMVQRARARAMVADRAASSPDQPDSSHTSKVSGEPSSDGPRRRLASSAGATPHANTLVVTADMLALPFGDGGFDVVTVGYGLRNVPDLQRALAEIQRVLVPGGRVLSLDFNRPDNPIVRHAYLSYLTVVGSALGWALHRDPDTYRYIPESIRNYPGAAGVAALLESHGFNGVTVVPVLGGLMTIHVATRM